MSFDADAARRALTDALKDASTSLQSHVLRGPSLEEASPQRYDIEADFAARVVEDLRAHTEALAAREIVPYDPSYRTSSHQVLVEDLPEIPDLAAVDARIRRGDLPRDEGSEPVVAMAHLLGDGEDALLAYRVKGAGIATRRSRGIPLSPLQGVYRPVQGEVLFYEPSVDVLTVRGLAFVTAVSLIQTRLHAPQKAQRLARETLRRATARVEVDGIAELEAAVVADPGMRAKMAQVARRMEADPEYAQLLTTERLVVFAIEHPEYAIATADQARLVFDPSPQTRWAIPKLLADDYLYSELTQRSYEAGSKSEVRADEE